MPEARAALDSLELDLPDEAATGALAAALAHLARATDVFALSGELGTGKTTFARAFIRARGGSEEVPSPTFTLAQVYEVADGTVIDAVAPDGVIEGIEVPGRRFCLGVQWHPEFAIDPGDAMIFTALVDAAR